jgi:hypothetical protein
MPVLACVWRAIGIMNVLQGLSGPDTVFVMNESFCVVKGQVGSQMRLYLQNATASLS